MRPAGPAALAAMAGRRRIPASVERRPHGRGLGPRPVCRLFTTLRAGMAAHDTGPIGGFPRLGYTFGLDPGELEPSGAGFWTYRKGGCRIL